ncbi:MAG TPA: DUF4424 family protein, partial [Allosphingosinicella sp.]|nr:DUF4424 family protein [Allosphingosinicella sp.]
MRYLLLAALGLVAAAAAANDGILEREAGGLVFKHNDQIDMLSEDLYVSLEQVRVRYRFRNRTPQDLRLTVGFPLPDHDLRADFYGDTAYPTNFRTLADGRPVAMQVEHRAFWQGVEHTERLNRLRIPIMYGDDDNLEPIERALSALPQAEQDRLLALGLVEPFDEPREGRRLTPLWTVRETWYWEQVFPAGRDLVIEHSYNPGAGGSVMTALTPDLRSGDYGAENAREMTERYCIEPDFLAALDRGWAGGRRPFSEHRVSYILTTGAGWRSPIGEFRLVVDKGRPENLVSF